MKAKIKGNRWWGSVLATAGLLLMLLLAPPAQAIPLLANFELYGEINRFIYYGYGNLEMTMTLDGDTLAQGEINYEVNKSPTTSGVFSSLTLPFTGWGVVDMDFSVPFDLIPDNLHSFSVDLDAHALRIVFDFSNNIQWTGSLIGNAGQQGLVLASITHADGTPLDPAIWQWEFIFPNTVERVRLSNDGSVLYSDEQHPPNVAYVNQGTAVGSASIVPLVKLSVGPEPNPLVYDYCETSISGDKNLRVVQVVPIPGAVWLLGSSLLSLGLFGRRRNKG